MRSAGEWHWVRLSSISAALLLCVPALAAAAALQEAYRSLRSTICRVPVGAPRGYVSVQRCQRSPCSSTVTF